jgi:peptide deformylase
LIVVVACVHDSTDPQIRRLRSPRKGPGRRAITPDIDRLVDDMIETMYAAPGVGLAAPQVGVPLRIFVVDVSVGRDPAGSSS